MSEANVPGSDTGNVPAIPNPTSDAAHIVGVMLAASASSDAISAMRAMTDIGAFLAGIVIDEPRITGLLEWCATHDTAF